ncbi:MAG TPA: PQQ-dependent sugar dehydrogenase, partial [Mycobacterium sp.]|nr:PQQ-dependent sugar dehydrogenase [Mycobacterium sp.]
FAEALGIAPSAPTAQQVAAADVHPPGEGPENPVGLPDDLERTTLVAGLNQPTDFRFLPDGSILIAEKGGAIKLYHDGDVHGEPLITLAVLPTDTDEERGLLGIEVDPDFEQNGYIYVSYTTAQNYDRLSRLTVTGHTVDPASELVLIESDQPGNIYHHGGEIHFGPDGKLYWAMGMNTNNPNSQNLSNVHGKILRLNPDGTVPEDNPFIDTPGAIDQIWAYGLRNPFRFTFTPDGQLLTGDVGGDAWEELNVVTKGANYGWPNAEGVCDGCNYVNPIYTYAHTPPPAKAGSITGVMVYTGDTLGAQYQNKVFIADYTLGWIKELTFDSTYSSFISERMFDDQAGTTVKLMQGPDGNIYQLNIFPGVLSVIAPSGGNRAPSAVITATPSNGLSPLQVNFSSAGSSDPDPNTTLTYNWNFGDGTTSSLANPTKTYTVNGPYDVTLIVSDGEKTGQATKRIVVGSTAPTAEILTPLTNSLYNAGDTISFSGLGTDAEDGALPDGAYNWTVQFHHADHVHPFRDNIVGPTGTITIPRSADNIDTTWYRITLTVTDSSGLSTSKSVDVKPRLVTLTINASDPDATFTVDGIPKKGSYTEQAVVGVERVIAAVSPQYVSDGQFVFNNWSDGGAQSHAIITPGANAVYTINYDRYIAAPAPWQETDVGHPTLAGYSSYDSGVFTIRGAGGDIWGPTDEFHYVHQSFNGDGTIIARVTSQTDTDDWAKSGIIIKESTAAGAKYVLLAVTPENGVTFQYNFSGDGGSAAYTFGDAWLKLERQGDVFTGYTSANGTDWTMVGQTTLAMATDVTAGLAVVSHRFDTLNTSTFDRVSVISNQHWTSTDVGGPRITGSTTIASGVHTLKGSGDDIWGDADQFHFSYQTLPGDGEIIARVSSFTDTSDGWAKAGVIIKQSTAAGADYALLAVTPANGINLQSGFDHNIAGPSVTPGNTWLKLERIGDTVTGFTSLDGQI